MPIPRNRFTVPTGIAILMLALTACFGSSDSNKSQQADTSSTTGQASETLAVPTSTPTIAATTPPPVVSETPTAQPQFARLSVPSTYKAGVAPASQNLNGAVNVSAYLQTVLRSNRDVWRTTWTANGLTMPTLTYDVTSQSDRYVSACVRGGKPIVVTAAYERLFYCSEDNKPNGSIALPTGVIAELWKKGADRKVADLAGAIAASRTSALVLTASLQRELSLPTPEPTSRQYVATCLAGVWAHGVYGQSAFTEKELAVALEYAYGLQSEVNGTAVAINPTDQLITAWVVGFRGGKISDCGSSYWR